MLVASDNRPWCNDNSGSWLCLPSTRQKQNVGKPSPLRAGMAKATVHFGSAEIPPNLPAHHDTEAGHQQLALGGPHPAPQSHGSLSPERAGSWSLQLLIKPGFPPKGGMATAGPLRKWSPTTCRCTSSCLIIKSCLGQSPSEQALSQLLSAPTHSQLGKKEGHTEKQPFMEFGAKLL